MSRWIRRSLLVLLPFALLVLVLTVMIAPRPARADAAANLFASPTGSGSACSQAAPCTLTKALGLTVNGDSVYLKAGTYTASGGAVISVTRAISVLCGWDGSATGPVARDPAHQRTVLDGENARRGLVIAAPGWVTVDGCVIIRGSGMVGPETGRGAGIMSKGANPVLTNNVITKCYASTSPAVEGWGAGIYVANAAQGQITGNLIKSNSAATQSTGRGGGVAMYIASGMTISGNLVLASAGSFTNGLGFGGGIYLEQCERVWVVGNELVSNVAQLGLAGSVGSHGGGLAIRFSSYITLTDNEIMGNLASAMSNGLGGGVSLYAARSVLLRRNRLDGNIASTGSGSAAGRGGGLACYTTAPLRLESNLVIANRAANSSWGYGGGMYLTRQTHFTLTNNVIVDNDASYEGGGMAFESVGEGLVTGTLLHNTFGHNNIGGGDGQNAIHVILPGARVTCINNLFTGHRYAVYAASGAAITLTRSLYYGNSVADVGGSGVINISPVTGEDPLVDSAMRLLNFSPAIDRGVPAGVTEDIDGEPRPMGVAPDIGADEVHWFATVLLFLPVLGRNAP